MSLLEPESSDTIMSESVIVSKLFVGGIFVEVYSHRDSLNSHLPVHALFLLHGRTMSTASVAPTAKSILEMSYGLAGTKRERDLIVITYASTLRRGGLWLGVTDS